MRRKIPTKYIEQELSAARWLAGEGDLEASFRHLERAHVLGQASTYFHTVVHVRMLALALRSRALREIWGQLFRIAGAAMKTPFGLYPTGNTGGANVWFFQSTPVPDDLQKLLNHHQ